MYSYEIIFSFGEFYNPKERLIIIIENERTEGKALSKLYVIFWGKKIFVNSIREIIYLKY